MKTRLLSLILVSLASSANGHGNPIDVIVNEGRLSPFVINGKTTFDTIEFVGGRLVSSLFADLPGIGVTNRANGVAVETALGLDVASPLAYWNGSLSPTDAELVVVTPDEANEYRINADSEDQSGLLWGVYDGTQFWEADGLYFLDAIAPQPGVYGTMVRLTSPSYETSEPFLLRAVYDPFLEFSETDRQLGFEAILDELTREPIAPGDVNEDGVVNGDDVDTLCKRIASSSSDGDFNGDAEVNLGDLDSWLNSNAKRNADANLDGQVAFLDFVALANNFGESGTKQSVWTSGDFDCNDTVDFSDFIILAQNFGQRGTSTSAVPEPRSVLNWWWIAGLPLLKRRGRQHI